MVLHCQVNQALVLYNCLQGPTLKEFSTLISTQIVIFSPRSNFILYCSLDSQSETPSDTWIHGLPFFILKTEVSDQANPDSSNPSSITFRWVTPKDMTSLSFSFYMYEMKTFKNNLD